MPDQTTMSLAGTLRDVEPAAVAGFISALNSASRQLGAIAGRLEDARVHDAAFGKLVDADKVRDAYHRRLPATEQNLSEARAVIEHFLGEFADVRTRAGKEPDVELEDVGEAA
ncbi:MAG: hypothetical protein ACRDSS_11735 [Actinocrinis sp.]